MVRFKTSAPQSQPGSDTKSRSGLSIESTSAIMKPDSLDCQRVRLARLLCTLLQRHACQQRSLHISKFSEEDISESGDFKEWIDQLQMVASINNWD